MLLFAIAITLLYILKRRRFSTKRLANNEASSKVTLMMTCPLHCRNAVIEIQRSPLLMKGKYRVCHTKPVLLLFFILIEFERQERLQNCIIPQNSIRILNIIGEGI